LFHSPETVESLFIAFRLTGDARYRDYGWRILQAIEKHCRVETGGYATVVNVDEVPARLEDKMETFMMVCFFALWLFLLPHRLLTERNFEVSLSALRRF
jgi:hypothetical protein